MIKVLYAILKTFITLINVLRQVKARKKLFEKIGKDAYKYRFQIKELKLGNPKAEKLLTIEIGGDNND